MNPDICHGSLTEPQNSDPGHWSLSKSVKLLLFHVINTTGIAMQFWSVERQIEGRRDLIVVVNIAHMCTFVYTVIHIDSKLYTNYNTQHLVMFIQTPTCFDALVHHLQGGEPQFKNT